MHLDRPHRHRRTAAYALAACAAGTVGGAGLALAAALAPGVGLWMAQGAAEGSVEPDPRTSDGPTAPVYIPRDVAVVAPAAALPGVTDPVGTPTVDGAGVLRAALERVAREAPGDAIAEQVTRLLTRDPDRDDMVAACVRFRDQLVARDTGLADELATALSAAGITELRADHEPFDPRRHEAVGTAPAPGPGDDGRVARTLRPGYRDGAEVLRAPQVVVHEWEEER